MQTTRTRISNWGGGARYAGFTLVELLVVIAIIGVLVALLLPAVQAAREAARRMQCSNHVKQLSLSLHNYHDTHFAFPCGSMDYGRSGHSTSEHAFRKSAHIALLPFIEQQAIYDTFMASGPSTCLPVMDPWNSYIPTGATTSVFDVRLTFLLCPSDGQGKAPASANNGPTSYRVCLGDWPDGPANGKIRNPRGAFSLYNFETRTMASMSDGTSNTAVFSEALIGNGAGRKIKGAVVTSSGTGAPTTMHAMVAGTNEPSKSGQFKAKTCWDLRSGKEYVSTATTNGDLMGRRLSDNSSAFTAFCTIFPPNGPSCLAGTAEHSQGVISPSSNHSGGVQVGLGDGSVRFVSDTIQAFTGTVTYATDPIIKTSGASQFGIWGALGSINGDESVAL